MLKRLFKALAKYQEQRAQRYTRSYRLEKYIESKGCHDVPCVEHWIREFEKQERTQGFC